MADKTSHYLGTAPVGNIRDNIALLAFKIAVIGALAGPQKLEDGFWDEFEDESGVDTGASENHEYDGANDLYKSSMGTDQCTGGTVLKYDENGTYPAVNAFDDNTSNRYITGSTAQQGVHYIGYQFGTGKKIDRVRIWHDGSYMPNSILVQYSDNGSEWTTLEEINPTFGEAWETFNLTNTDETHEYWRLLCNQDMAGTWALYEIEMIETAPGFTLISQNETAESNNPAKARLVFLVDYNGESVTINTDIKGYVSMDDGANFDQITLEDQGLYETDKHIVSGEGPLTARDDKEMVIKFETDNSKDVYLEDWACFWDY